MTNGINFRTFGCIQQKLLRFPCQCVLYPGSGKTFTETHQMLRNAYGDDFLSRMQVYEWFGRFKSGRETLDDDERSGRPRTGLSEENIEKVREFIKNNKRSSVTKRKVLNGEHRIKKHPKTSLGGVRS